MVIRWLVLITDRVRNKTGVANNAEEIEKLKRICKDLEEKSNYIEDKASENQTNIESCNLNMSMGFKNVHN